MIRNAGRWVDGLITLHNLGKRLSVAFVKAMATRQRETSMRSFSNLLTGTVAQESAASKSANEKQRKKYTNKAVEPRAPLPSRNTPSVGIYAVIDDEFFYVEGI